MKNTQTSDIQIFESLRNALGFFGDETNVIYKSKFVDKNTGFVFNSSDDLLNSLHEFGFQGKTLKEAGFELEDWYELLRQQQTTVTEVPRPEGLNNTTLTSDQLEDLGEFADKRTQQNIDIRAREKQTIDDFIKQNQERIATAQKLQEKLRGKVLYAKVVQPEQEVLSEKEQKEFETLKRYATDENIDKSTGSTPKQILINDLSVKIEEIVDIDLKNLTPEEKHIVAQTYAVKLVEEIAKPEIDGNNIQTAILASLSKEIESNSDTIQKIELEDSLFKLVREGSSTLETESRSGLFATKEISKRLFGDSITSKVFGPRPEQLTVSFVSGLSTSEPTHIVDLGSINQEYSRVLTNQNTFAESIREIGVSRVKNIFIGEARSFLGNRVIKSPVGSLISKDPVLNGIFSKYVLGDRVVWQTVSQGRFVGLVMKVAPDTAGPVLGLAGKALGKEFVKPVVGQAVGKIAVQTGVKAGFGAFLAKGAAAIGVSLGVFTAGVSTAITIATVAIGKLINWPKIKQWLIDNKEIFVIGGAGLGLMLGGPVAGLVTGGLLMAATGTLGAFATGAFSVLGFIGRSVGIAIATPVIITLLVLPPLVAFIMLVINNSAYVLPPKPVSDSPFAPGGGSFYCTDQKESSGISYSVNSPIATRALGIVEDLYQGFWCFWNRSPGDFPTDTTEYPPSYPELFNQKLFASNPNPGRGEVSSCGECLFWCTWLVQKAYKENGVDLLYTLWSPSMYTDFEDRGKIKLKQEVTPTNVEPGAVVFFDVDNGLNRIDHVGVVYSVNSDGITFVQSNAGMKKDFIPFNSSGVGITDLPGIKVVGIGNP